MATDRIKVIHVITRLDKGGSAENTVLTLAGLDRNRYDLVLVKGPTTESEMSRAESVAVEQNLRKLGERGVHIATVPTLLRRVDPYGDLLAFFALFRIFRRERPAIVHTHTSKAGILGRWAARLTGCALIVHTPHGHIFWGYFGRFLTSAFLFLERWTAPITSRIIVLTEQEKKDHLALDIAPERKFATIHSGVALDDFSKPVPGGSDLRRELGIQEDAFVIGSVGRLTAVKGHRFLIEAAGLVVAVYPETKFIVLGHGELKGALEEQAARLGLAEHILFLGWRPDVARVLSIFDLFVLPSLNEGMGKVLIESMASGKPIIASRIGGIVDLIEEGKNGVLVPPADSGALAQAILKLREDGALRRALAECGRQTATHFSDAAMVQKIHTLYCDLLSHPRENK